MAVTEWSLEMPDPSALRPRPSPSENVRFVQVHEGKAGLSARLYSEVGSQWYWTDRTQWAEQQWAAWTDRPEHHLFVVEVVAENVAEVAPEICGSGCLRLIWAQVSAGGC